MLYRLSVYIILHVVLNVLLTDLTYAQNDFIIYKHISSDMFINKNDKFVIDGEFLSSDIFKYQIWISKPDNTIEKIEKNVDETKKFSIDYELIQDGKYEIEMMYRNKKGPQVAFQYTIRTSNEYSNNNIAITIIKNTTFDKALYDYNNQIRKYYKINNLKISSNLNKIASSYAKEISDNNHFEHISIDGKTLLDRIFSIATKNKYNNKFGENLVIATNPIDAITKLNKSVAHKKSMIDKEFKYVGIGYATMYTKNNKKYYIFVQNFAKEDI